MIVTDLWSSTLEIALERRVWTWDHVFLVAISLAEAVSSLHSWTPCIVHCHLRPQCILLNRAWALKVADLSHARPDGEALEALEFTPYMAPEVASNRPATTRSDSYSFGMILWELVARCLVGRSVPPFPKHTYESISHLTASILQGVRPDFPPGVPDPLKQLITASWSTDPSARPSIQSISHALEQLQEIYQFQRSNA